MPAAVEPLKRRLLHQLQEHERELDYFTGHQSKVMLEMIKDGWVTLNGKGIVKITDAGSRVLRNDGALRRRSVPKLLWWIGTAAALLLASEICIYCLFEISHTAHGHFAAGRPGA